MPSLRNKVSLLFQAFNSTELRIRPRGDATQLPLLNELIKSGHPSPTSRDGKFSAFADWSQSHPRMCPGRQHDMHWTARSNKLINEPATIVRSPRSPPHFYTHRRSDSHLTTCPDGMFWVASSATADSTPIPSIPPPPLIT